MPIPKPGEKRSDFVSRCVPFVIDEEKKKGKSIKPDHAAAKCHGIFDQSKKKATYGGCFFSVNSFDDWLVIKAADKENRTNVQTLIFSKEKFPTREAATNWAKGHGFSADTIRETTSSWRIRQKPPEDFENGTFITITFGNTSGVQGVTGKLKRGS